jgi:RNA polymerase sigma-70 factor (ECF subfamily)
VSAEDLELVRRCVAGDGAAWEEFVRRTRSAIHRGATLALRKFRALSSDSLDNVHQQVYVELLRKGGRVLRSFEGKSDLEGWVAVISMRTAYQLMRRRGLPTALGDLVPRDPAPAPGERAEQSEFLDRLTGALGALKPEERRLLQMAFFEKRSYREIASALGVPLNSVSPLLIRAKEKLRRSLE